MQIDPHDHALLRRRLTYYRPNYPGDRLRSRLVDDGFDPDAVDRALVEALESSPTDAYGVRPIASAPSSWLVTWPPVVATAAVVSVLTGIVPWAPTLAGRTVLVQVPFAAMSALVGLDLVALVKTRYDLPNVSRGIGIGIVGGIALFVAVFVYVFRQLGASGR